MSGDVGSLGVFEIARAVKRDSLVLMSASLALRNGALGAAADALWARRADIAAANERDLADGERNALPLPIMKRLLFDEKKLSDTLQGVRDLIALPDSIGRVRLERELDSDLLLRQVTCPIGVIGVIFESRPDALVQIASLCLKSGNCAILKGGSEARETNRILYEIIHGAGAAAGLPDNFLRLLESRAETSEMLGCHESIDLIIPRGSNAFVRYIMDHSDIPVMGHSDGICHIYADKAADVEKAVRIIRDSKVQYAAACNAVETVLVHEDIARELLPALQKELAAKGVQIRGDGRVIDILADAEPAIAPATEEDFATEYLDYIVSIKVVRDEEEAIAHINHYGSHHTDAIVTEDEAAAARFMSGVDSAGVYRNCSTRFADGFRYGLGAEVGISTGKLHARGPVGLDGLTTYKYLLSGNGNIVEDYAEGRRSFHFRDL
ncbi:MAG: glutamate-5-semialdehyde dehydrogenase [Clostridiales Family XIII bacterium]|jgi:glutamate-5-semialdehyde dehydrogenase|nr:glutamate-5-semialdehyde dehydrogenase [Clostridiales Family XIII bacterium]